MPFDLADRRSALSKGGLDPCIVDLSEIILEASSPCMELREILFCKLFYCSLFKCVIMVCAWCVEDNAIARVWRKTHVIACMWSSKDKFMASVLSPNLWVPGLELRLADLYSKHH